MTDTNIKNLPEGTYFTEIGYSQQYPWLVIRETPTTRELVKVVVDRDPEFTPNILPGGFCGHCDNQHLQTWLYKGIRPTETVTIRKTKHGWSRNGVRFIEGRAREFYDWNF